MVLSDLADAVYNNIANNTMYSKIHVDVVCSIANNTMYSKILPEFRKVHSRYGGT